MWSLPRIGHVFCFQCRAPPHKPVPCDLVVKWRKQSGEGDNEDEATERLLAAQSKPCPNCNIRIIKGALGC